MNKPTTASAIVTVDLVIVRKPFGFEPELLLIRRGREPYQGTWALPGGQLADEDATLEDAGLRELREETGLVLPWPRFLRQLHTYGNRDRDPRPGRWISVAFYAPIINSLLWQQIVDRDLYPGDDADAAAWWNILSLPQLAFDHKDIVMHAFASDVLAVEYHFR